MNKSHRSIWNETLGTWVAAPEFASARGKGSKAKVVAGVVAALIAGGFGMARTAQAAPASYQAGTGATTGTVLAYPGTTNPWNNPLVTTTTGIYEVAIGNNANTIQGGTALGDTASTSGFFGVALGAYTVAAGHGTAVGSGAMANGYAGSAFGYNALASGGNSTALGQFTTAAGASSVALGDTSIASGNQSIAIGQKANAAADNSVALGANSTTTANLNAAAYNPGATGLSGTAPAGEVSVGSAGNERRLTNVAAGSAATDAVNVSQLQSEAVKSNTLGAGTAAALGGGATYDPTTGTVTAPNYSVGGTTFNSVGAALGNIDGRTTANTNNIAQNASDIAQNTTNIAQNTGDITTLQGQMADAVMYDSPAHDSVTLGGTGASSSVALHNVAAGDVSSSSTDAVNGSQLYATASSAASALGGGSTVNADGTISAPSYNVGGTTVNNVGDAIANIDGRTTTNTNDIAQNTTNIAQNTSDITNLQGQMADAVAYDSPTHDSVTLGGSGASAPVALHNVAVGEVSSSSTDAVNGSQLYATASSTASALGGGSTVNADGSISAPSYNVGGTTVNNVGDALTNLDGRTTQNTTDIANVQNQISSGSIGLVQQDPTTRDITVGKDTDGTLVNMAGTAGDRTVTGVAAGAVNASSVDAVNGSQLYSTASSAASALGGGSTVNADGSISAPSYSVGGTTVSNVGDAITNIDGRTTTNTTNIAQNTTNIAQNTSDITNLQGQMADAVAYDSPAHDSVTLGGSNASAPVALHNVAAGDVSSASTDAVNGSQLYATASSAASALGGGSTVNADGSISAPSYSVGGTTVSNVGDAITNIDGRTTQNTTEIANVQNQISNGSIGLVQQDPATRDITVGKDTDGTLVNMAGTAGERTVTGVAAGAVNASSVDAVNGGQLYATASSAASALGGGATVNADGTISAPSYSVGGTTVHNVGDAITNIDNRTTQNTTDITNMQNQLSDGSIGLVQQDPTTGNLTVGKDTDGTVVDMTGTEGARTVTGVAAGSVSAASVDAINGSQLYGTASSTASALGGGSTVNADGTIGAPSYNIGGTLFNNVGGALTNLDGRVTQNTADISTIMSQMTDLSSEVSNGQSNSPYFNATDTSSANASPGNSGSTNAAVVNAAVPGPGVGSTAAGSGAVASSDYATAVGASASATGTGSTAVGAGAQAVNTNSVALGQGSVTDRDNSVSVGSATQQRQITNVAAGTADTDAVNVGQMNSSVAQGVSDAKSYSDQLFNQTNQAINDVARNAYAGIAAAMAMPNMTPSGPGRTIVAAGGATYKGGSAAAVGATYRSRNGNWLVNGAVSVTSTGDAGVRAQVGYEF
ncbi:ESPR-type extended signal peptide-containing protein [Paraburkholderia sp. J12]|uniref:ESPR-type extended signal peptide-containing protein n=1 Tax=Paraburkholderia sp. J12 TaxID=2805432 RepID=UPI002ABDFFDD|nr:ESPR-type extended signal peptide-containing protein [Paraburkholderia sp. J12]